LTNIRKRRRDRTRNRIANQKRLDAIASAEINKNMWSSADTWGATVCPNCNKSLPSRAFIAGYHTSSIDNTCFISVGTAVDPRFCHADITKCHHESATEKNSNWKLANDYIANKKEIKRLRRKQQHFENKYQKEQDKIRNRFNFKAQIIEDWESPYREACLRILDVLLFRNLDLDNISFADLCSYPNKEIEVLKLLPYITGERTHLLDMKWYFLDENEIRYELSDDQARAANTGEIRHPVTDEILDYVEASAKVFMYFVASDLIREIRSEVNV